MYLPVLFIIAAKLLNVFCNTESSEGSTERNDSLKSDAKYESLVRVLDFYNTENLVANWINIRQNLTAFCDRDLSRYIRGLRGHEEWALKMEDASGRYSTGWFWGNHYWTGSRSLCENLAPEGHFNLQKTAEQNATTRGRRNAPKPIAVSPSASSAYIHGPLVYTSLPPFPVSFFMLRISVNTSLSKEGRLLHVGLCLPQICTDEDVKIVMQEASKASKQASVQVENIRSSHHNFYLFEDVTFRILCGVSFVVIMLLAAGTGYDLHRKSKEMKKKVLTINCTTYTNASQKFGAESIKLDMPDTKTKNGKCRLYVVNNNNNNVQEQEKKILDPNDESFLSDVCKELLLSFSLKKNVKNICDRTVGSDTIPVIHGLKAISMAWVILGHTCIVAFKYSDNMEFRKLVQKELIFQTISNGAFSVDTFFFTSGLLVAFLYFRTNAKGKLEKLSRASSTLVSGCLHFLGLIGYRYVRLTAPYLFVLGVAEVTMKWFNYNSIFEPPTMDHLTCSQYWWRNILYINTFFPVEEMCLLWSWYLSDDTQFYVVGAILLILATYHFKTAASLVVMFILSSWITTGYIAFSNNHMPHMDDPLALFDQIYDKPWTRFGPYLIGMVVGWILFKTDCRIRISKLMVVVGWFTSSVLLLSLIYGLYNADLSLFVGAAYSSLSHSAWAIGLAWIVIACSTGYGGYVNSILSATILYPISRVTYCAYLVHPIMIRFVAMNMDSPIHLGKDLMFVLFLGQVVASYVVAFIVSVAFEAPAVSMLRILAKLPTSNHRKTNATN